MSNNKRLWIRDKSGSYFFFKEPVKPKTILRLASKILEGRMKHGIDFTSPQDASKYLCCDIGDLEYEAFVCLYLDTRHQLISSERLFHGTIDGASVHPREVVKRALHFNAAAIIFGHNHPSGVAEPSQADVSITVRLRDALRLVDIRVLDHIVVSGTDHVSMAQRGHL